MSISKDKFSELSNAIGSRALQLYIDFYFLNISYPYIRFLKSGRPDLASAALATIGAYYFAQQGAVIFEASLAEEDLQDALVGKSLNYFSQAWSACYEVAEEPLFKAAQESCEEPLATAAHMWFDFAHSIRDLASDVQDWTPSLPARA